MPAHRKNFDKAVELYKAGFSIAEVAKQFSVTRQAMHKILARRNVDMRKPNLQPVVEWGGRRFTLRENGYYAETSGARDYLHRAMWIDAHGPIPEGHEVHHKDEDKTHNCLNNFELLTSSEHGKKHGFRGNQYIGKSGKRD
ncbi:HNH endonuclease [Burkholderia multivorans]|nr:HNH endonuclease [Burkholderia multivorans]